MGDLNSTFDILQKMQKQQQPAQPPPTGQREAPKPAPSRAPGSSLDSTFDLLSKKNGGGDYEKPLVQPEQEEETPWYNTSLVKAATGKSISERINPTMEKWERNLEGMLPESWRGNDYVHAIGKAAADLPGGLSDGLLTPLGVAAVVANFTPAGPYVDYSLGAYQAVQTIDQYWQAIKQIEKEGRPHPDTVANALFGTALSLGTIRMGREVAEHVRNTGAAWTAAEQGRRVGSAIRYLSGIKSGQVAAKAAKGILREQGSIAFTDMNRAHNQLADSLTYVESLPEKDRMESLDLIEKAGRTATGERAQSGKQKTQKLADAELMLTTVNDNVFKSIVQTGISADDAWKHFNVNYMARYFKEFERGQASMQALFNNRPYKGQQAFREARTIMGPIKDYLESIDPKTGKPHGDKLHLVTSNWVELGLFKIQEMLKFRMALQAAREMNGRGMLHSFNDIKQLRPGWDLIEDRIIPKSEMNAGRYLAAPRDIAIAFNNYLAPGLEYRVYKRLAGVKGRYASNAIRFIKGFNNTTSRFLVGASAFHLLLSASLSATDAVALAPMYAVRGKFKKAGVAAVKGLSILGAPIEDWQRGSALLEHARNPLEHPELAPYLEALQKGGGRAGLDPAYHSMIMDHIFKRGRAAALRSGSPLRGGVYNVLRYAANFIMEKAVPNLKAGAFMRMADYEMDLLGQEHGDWRLAPVDEQRFRFGRVSDSIDNRHGQLIYDNLFWPRTVRDAGHIGLQFLGWTVGTYREVGGGVWDVFKEFGLKPMTGTKPEITPRMAWTFFTFAVTIPYINAIYQYLSTGKLPEKKEGEMFSQDYFYPRTGKKNADGTDQRVALPSTAYWRTLQQVWPWRNYGFDPSRSASGFAGRTSNFLMDLYYLFTNSDYQKRELWQVGEPTVNNFAREVLFLLGRASPISAQSFMQGDTQSPGSALQSFIGMRKAPTEEMRSGAQNLLMKYSRAQYREGPFDEFQFEKRQASTELADQLVQGTANAATVTQAAQDRKISVSDARRLLQVATVPAWHPRGYWGSKLIHGLSAENMISVFRAASMDEKDQIYKFLGPYFERTIRTIGDKDRQIKARREWARVLQQYQADRKEESVAPPEARQ